MKIIEQYSLSKSGNSYDNEDVIVSTDDFVAVIDGMTPKEFDLYKGSSSACIVIELAAQEIRKFPASITCEEAVYKLIQCVQQYYRDRQIFEEVAAHPSKRLGASLIVYSRMRKELWMIGDCQGLIDGAPVSNEKLIDHLIADMRSKLIKGYLDRYSVEDLLEHDRSRYDIYPFLINQFEFQNNKHESLLSYAVLDGFPIHKEHIKKIEVPDAKEIVLASDGYPFLKQDRTESERLLNELLEKDPLCYRIYPSTKGLKKGNVSFDDRSFVKITCC